MPNLGPGILTIVLGVAFFAVGTAISFGFADLDLRFLEFQLVLVFYLLTSVLAFSGLILTILGVGRVLRGQDAIGRLTFSEVEADRMGSRRKAGGQDSQDTMVLPPGDARGPPEGMWRIATVRFPALGALILGALAWFLAVSPWAFHPGFAVLALYSGVPLLFAGYLTSPSNSSATNDRGSGDYLLSWPIRQSGRLRSSSLRTR